MVVGKLLQQFQNVDANAILAEVIDAVSTRAHTSAMRLAPVDTGQLKMTITKEEVTTTKHEVIAHAPYAIYVEYGTGPKGSNSPDKGDFTYHQGEVTVRTKHGQHIRRTEGTHPRPFMRTALREARNDAEKLLDAIAKGGMPK